MKHVKPIVTAAAAALLALTGCQSDPAPVAPAPAPKPTVALLSAGVADKDATHVVTADSPYYMRAPGQGDPTGTIKSGTKVLMMIPSGDYTKCTVADGKSVYVKTAMLKPLGN